MYTLRWLASKLDALADLYVTLSVEDRARLASAVEALNARLRSNPNDEGESRANGFRITFIPFLSVAFRINEGKRTVDVTSILRFGS